MTLSAGGTAERTRKRWRQMNGKKYLVGLAAGTLLLAGTVMSTYAADPTPDPSGRHDGLLPGTRRHTAAAAGAAAFSALDPVANLLGISTGDVATQRQAGESLVRDRAGEGRRRGEADRHDPREPQGHARRAGEGGKHHSGAGGPDARADADPGEDRGRADDGRADAVGEPARASEWARADGWAAASAATGSRASSPARRGRRATSRI